MQRLSEGSLAYLLRNGRRHLACRRGQLVLVPRAVCSGSSMSEVRAAIGLAADADALMQSLLGEESGNAWLASPAPIRYPEGAQ